jgi:hypothetical protein
MFLIYRVDGEKMQPPVSGLNRGVNARRFKTADAAHAFQEKVLKVYDPEGLLAGHYVFDAPHWYHGWIDSMAVPTEKRNRK